MNITDKSNLNKIAIVVIGYNRLDTTTKLLDSLNSANYPSDDIPLVISIDKSGNEDLYNYVRSFSWRHGEKYAIIREEKMGLEKHIFACGAYSQYFKAVVILEDDVIVAPDFYNYFETAVEKYGNDESVSCISAYFNYLNGYVGLPFQPMTTHDVFAIQEVSSTGECFTRRMWSDFVDWKTKNTPLDFSPFDMPVKIKRWRDAWTKYFNAYMVANDKYCIYPIFSTITNSGAAGVHSQHSETSVQTFLMMGIREWNMPSFIELEKYDIFGNNICLYNVLGYSKKDLCLDIYGNNPNIMNKPFVLSVNQMPFEIIKGFELCFRPQELNVILNNDGDDLRLYNTQKESKRRHKKSNKNVVNYHLHGFHVKYLPLYSILTIFDVLKEKLKKML